jgi:hypothetical protein
MGSTITETHALDQQRSSSFPAGDLCHRCRHNPASTRIFGYCSWDCHDSDGDEDQGDEAA